MDYTFPNIKPAPFNDEDDECIENETEENADDSLQEHEFVIYPRDDWIYMQYGGTVIAMFIGQCNERVYIASNTPNIKDLIVHSILLDAYLMGRNAMVHEDDPDYQEIVDGIEDFIYALHQQFESN